MRQNSFPGSIFIPEEVDDFKLFSFFQTFFFIDFSKFFLIRKFTENITYN